jgi:hypothetical protein
MLLGINRMYFTTRIIIKSTNYRTFTFSGTGFSCFTRLFCYPILFSHDPNVKDTGLGCSHFVRHYFGNRVCFLFLQLLRCFSSLRCLFPAYEFSWKYKRFSYSGIFGSMLVSSSPKHIVGSTPFIVSRCLGIHPTP